MSWQERVRHPSVGALAAIAFVAVGCVIGLDPLRDNSFFTHLATGRVILDTHSVPTHDVYSFTAHGEPWVVQSWLASVIFAGAERLGGANGIRILFTVTTGLLALLGWRLSRPGEGLVARIAATGLLIGVATEAWAERPLLFGLLFMSLALLAAEDGLDSRWLVPIFWLWVSTHGSFPLGLVALGLLAVGRRLDRGDATVELRALRWAAIGTALSVINPLGPKLLLFPLDLLQRSGSLKFIQEWQAPTFTSGSERFFLVQIALAVIVLVRRPSYRMGLPIAVFVAAALLGSRNVAVASLMLVPIIAEGLRGLGTIATSTRPSVGLSGAMALIAGTALVVVVGLGQEPIVTRFAYPVRALDWLHAQGVDTRTVPTATQDYVGNYLEAVYGPGANTFFDDRVDMYPPELVTDTYAVLQGAAPGWEAVLDRHDIDLVIWSRDEPLSQVLTADAAWRQLYGDDLFVVACRRTADIC